jgi:hypothetical protein
LGNVIDEEVKAINDQFKQPQYPPPPPPPAENQSAKSNDQSPSGHSSPHQTQPSPPTGNHPPYPPPYPPPYYSPYQQFNSKRALQLMYIAIILIIVSSFLDSLSYFYLSTVEYEFSIGLFLLLGPVYALQLIAGALFFFFFIMVIISVVLFKTDEYHFGEKHRKNMKWAVFFTIGFALVYGGAWIVNIWFAFVWPSMSAIITLYSIQQAMYIARSLFLVFMVFLPISAIAGMNEKDKMYLFATGMIAVIILRGIVDMFSIDNFGLFEPGIAIAYGVLYLIEALIWISAFLAYRSLWNSSKQYGREIPKDSKPFLPRPKPLDRPLYNFYSRPVQAFIVIVIIAIILGAAEGASLMRMVGLDDNEPNIDFLEFDEEFEGSPGSFSSTGLLGEGESEEIQVPLFIPITLVEVTLTWFDEDDDFPRENQPDYFSLEVTCAHTNTMDQASNQQGGQGMIFVDIEDVDAEVDNYAYISITLVSAGDQTGPRGSPFGPWVVQDNENTWELTVDYY